MKKNKFLLVLLMAIMGFSSFFGITTVSAAAQELEDPIKGSFELVDMFSVTDFFIEVYQSDTNPNHYYYYVGGFDLSQNKPVFIRESFFIENSATIYNSTSNKFEFHGLNGEPLTAFGVLIPHYDLTNPDLHSKFYFRVDKSAYTSLGQSIPSAAEIALNLEFFEYNREDVAWSDVRDGVIRLYFYFPLLEKINTYIYDVKVFYSEEINVYDSEMPTIDFLKSNVYGIYYYQNESYEFSLDVDLTKTTYNSSSTTPGNYVVVYYHDYVGNRMEYIQKINVFENIVTINGPNLLSVDISTTMTDEEIISNYIGHSTAGYSVNIEIESNNYNQSQTPGVYTVNLKATDTVGKTASRLIQIRVIDAIAPVITGPSEILLAPGKSLSSLEILSRFKVTDNHDTAVVLKIKQDNYKQNLEIGNYLMILTATDVAGNSTEFYLTIKVKDMEAPVITGVSQFYIGKSQLITINDLLRLHFQAYDNVDGDITSSIKILHDAFTGNADTTGNYQIRLGVTDSNGNPTNFDFRITVVNNMESYYLADRSIYVANSYILTDGDVLNAMSYIYGIKNPDRPSFVIEDYRNRYDELYFSKQYQFRWIDTTGQSYAKDFNIVVINSNLFNPGGSNAGSIVGITIMIIIIGFGVLFVVMAAKKRKRRRY